MNTGHVISGAGHIGLIGWLFFGANFAPTPEPFQVNEVAVISSAEFEALLAGTTPPEAVTDMVLPVPPETPPPPQPAPAVSPPPAEAPTPVPSPAPSPEQPPAPPPAQPLPPSDVQEEPPQIAPPPQEQAVLAPEISDRPSPRPAPRVAPEPVATPEPDTKVDDIVQEAATPAPSPDPAQQKQEATAPEAATTEIVTEAAEKPSAAPVSSVRPRARPNRPEAVAAPNPPATPAPVPAPAATRDAVQDALQQALADATAPSVPAYSGPPISAGERDALRVAVQKCWNVGSLSTDALRTTVVVSVSMTEDGKPVVPSIRMRSFSGGSQASAQQAFDSARRAIIRCGTRGYDLPAEKYALWQEIEMTFNPEKMRIK